MAEFSELVQIKKRICAKYKKKVCNGCPISADLCGIISISDYSDWDFKKLENAMISWAAEHPEPVYPTWLEWLIDKGLIIKTDNTYSFSFEMAVQRMPADVVEKLEGH